MTLSKLGGVICGWEIVVPCSLPSQQYLSTPQISSDMKAWYHLGYCVAHSHCVTECHVVSLCSFLCAGGLRAMGPMCQGNMQRAVHDEEVSMMHHSPTIVPWNTHNQYCLRNKVASMPILSRVQVSLNLMQS